ncbi:hypothetical protein AKJ62_00805 [candidate division MSBL1 archaeon SCGC-AAA259D14]|uniref:Rad51-like C-terminal domain-containing protein n=1 Tax=candidate division MSBL1 archaeon SCGC-AAA259D14 TaxID=1698261 RepID=A0A133U8K0_9EURY|nr:hypothetical protein AKJ62_00805 [candidate division MSBL1 archaeon SCGC-AAA259D14]
MRKAFDRDLNVKGILEEAELNNLILDEKDSSAGLAHELSAIVLTGRTGFEPPVLWLDGDNSFNPYRVSELSRNYGLIPEQALGEVFISRAFTCYQMMSLIFDRLEEAVERLGPEFIVITGLPSLFSGSDLPEREALRAFDPVVKSLKKFLDTDVAILLTGSRFGEKNEFTSRLESISDHVTGPEKGNPSLRKNGSPQAAARTPSLEEFA